MGEAVPRTRPPDAPRSASAKAQHSARWLTLAVLRNHIEAQAAAIRRFAYSGGDPRPMSFGKILAGVAQRPALFDQAVSDEAASDLATLTSKVESVDTFADKFVAHLDADHASAPLTLDVLDDAHDFIVPLWVRWFERIVGRGIAEEAVLETGWAERLRLVREPGPHERFASGGPPKPVEPAPHHEPVI